MLNQVSDAGDDLLSGSQPIHLAQPMRELDHRPANRSRGSALQNVQRNFFATAPNQKWATDITEFNVNGQKLHLSACMDLYNREIIAHCIARRPVFKLVSDTLRSALERAKGSNELMVHSDQGWHYKMQPYRSLLRDRGVVQSMSRKGNCFDNAVIESFFGTLKAECLHLAKPSRIEELEAGVHGKRSLNTLWRTEPSPSTIA